MSKEKVLSKKERELHKLETDAVNEVRKLPLEMLAKAISYKMCEHAVRTKKNAMSVSGRIRNGDNDKLYDIELVISCKEVKISENKTIVN